MDEKIIVEGTNYVVREIQRRDLRDLNYLLNDAEVLKLCIGSPFSKASKQTVARLLFDSLKDQKIENRVSFDLALEPPNKGEGLMGLICLGKIPKFPTDIKLTLLTRGDYLDEGYPIQEAVNSVMGHCIENMGIKRFRTYIPQRMKSLPLQSLFGGLGFVNTLNTQSRAYFELAI